ncbi:thymidine kinase [Gorillibacterium massiliense]|uniref:thymidine kinase n=1 Tax=Gorillibacterium massiliense TaxID=1280390 RepID=UPI0004B216F0|nr:thymidine kinase [Gorillibacterium massiliense]
MAKLYYRYGTMNSGKSMDILKIANNYEEQGKKVLIFTSSFDTRHGIGKVTSRVGFQREALLLGDDLLDVVSEQKPNCVIVDEAQFLSEDQVDKLAFIVDNMSIPVMAFGLMTDFQGKLFSGSKRLLELADRIEEVKTICWYCDSKARFNTRFSNGRAVFKGEQIELGGNDKYLPLCRKCYMKEQERSEAEAKSKKEEQPAGSK